jgi:hypothetical protein
MDSEVAQHLRCRIYLLVAAVGMNHLENLCRLGVQEADNNA